MRPARTVPRKPSISPPMSTPCVCGRSCLEISVLQWPSSPPSRLPNCLIEYRTLGLGYANIGGLLMASGIPYDSPMKAALFAARMTAIMTGVAYATSAEMAKELGPFPGYTKPTRRICCGSCATIVRPLSGGPRAMIGAESYEPVPLDIANCPDERLVERARAAWDQADWRLVPNMATAMRRLR